MSGADLARRDFLRLAAGGAALLATGAVGDLAELVAADSRSQPADKYRLLAGAAEWTTNMGYPGHTNAACQEVLDTSVISQMFASAATGAMTAEEAVRAAEARTNAIYDKWREQGKI